MAKARCGECGLRFDAPNEARGKTVPCPDCDSRVRVPKSKKKAKKKRRRPEEESDAPQSPDSFMDIDLKRVHDHNVIICPKCAQEVDEEDIECPHCGVNIDTGKLSEKQKRLKKTKGPDPDEFSSNVWGDSFFFMGRQWLLALWSTLYLSIFLALWFFCAHMTFWCSRKPPKVFWACMGFLFLLGAFGWMYHQFLEIVRVGQKKKKEPGPRDIQFDFFHCMSLGVRIAAYPFVVSLPFAWTGIAILVPIICLPIALAHMTQKYTYRAWLIYYQVRIFMKNAGATMMWFLVFLAGFGVQLIVILVIFLTSAAGKIYHGDMPEDTEAALWRQNAQPSENWGWVPSGFVGDQARDLAKSIAGSEEGFTYNASMHALIFLLFFCGGLLIASAFAWPSLMVARACAIYAYYRNIDLEHVNEHKDGELAGFWIRYQATVADTLMFMLAPFVVPAKRLALVFLWLVNGKLYLRLFAYVLITAAGVDILPSGFALLALTIANFSAAVYNFVTYFAVSEAAFERATIAKAAIGLNVTDADGNQISMARAYGRSNIKLFGFLVGAGAAFGMAFPVGYIVGSFNGGFVLSSIFFGLPLTGVAINITAAFDDEKRALHDMACDTRVRWRGLQE